MPVFFLVGKGECRDATMKMLPWYLHNDNSNDDKLVYCSQVCLSRDDCRGFQYVPTTRRCNIFEDTPSHSHANRPAGFSGSGPGDRGTGPITQVGSKPGRTQPGTLCYAHKERNGPGK